MKKTIDFHFIILIFLISFFSIEAKENACVIYQDSQKQKIVNRAIKKSLRNKNKFYVEIFSSKFNQSLIYIYIIIDKKDNFDILKNFRSGLNSLLKNVIQVEFYCKDETIANVSINLL